jgi:hypothetical protein
MTLGEQILSTLITSGALVGLATLFAREFIKSSIKAHFDEELEAQKHEYAQSQAAFTAKLQAAASETAERLRAEYARQLEDVRGSVQKQLQEIQHAHDDLQEQLKDALFRRTQDTLEILKLRRELYRPLVEIIYRARNQARDILHTRDAASLLKWKQQLDERSLLLEETVFKLRADLERDMTFAPVHAYKNDCKNFAFELGEYLRLDDAQQQSIADQTFDRLRGLFEKLDSQCASAVTTLALSGSAERIASPSPPAA